MPVSYYSVFMVKRKYFVFQCYLFFCIWNFSEVVEQKQYTLQIYQMYYVSNGFFSSAIVKWIVLVLAQSGMMSYSK